MAAVERMRGGKGEAREQAMWVPKVAVFMAVRGGWELRSCREQWWPVGMVGHDGGICGRWFGGCGVGGDCVRGGHFAGLGQRPWGQRRWLAEFPRAPVSLGILV